MLLRHELEFWETMKMIASRIIPESGFRFPDTTWREMAAPRAHEPSDEAREV